MQTIHFKFSFVPNSELSKEEVTDIAKAIKTLATQYECDIENFTTQMLSREECKMCQCEIFPDDRRYPVHEGVACEYCYKEPIESTESVQLYDLVDEYEQAYAHDAIPETL